MVPSFEPAMMKRLGERVAGPQWAWMAYALSCLATPVFSWIHSPAYEIPSTTVV